MTRRAVKIVLLALFAASCKDAVVTPPSDARPDDANLAVGGIPGPPPGVIVPTPPGPPPRVPVPLPPKAGPKPFLTNIVEIGAGSGFSCALRSDGIVYCWGSNGSGQLGDGSQAPSVVPVEVSGATRFERLFVGDVNVCALTAAGAAYCWGDNSQGQLGNGSSSALSRVPAPVAGGHTFVDISVGLRTTCGVGNDGVTYCWGSNQNGLFATGLVGGTSNVPVAIPTSAALGFASVSVGFFHACALTSLGAAYCWGSTPNLGNGAPSANAFTPVPAAGNASFASIEVGSLYTCALSASGAASCWGGQSSGELGTGGLTNTVLAVTPVAGGLSFSELDANNNNSAIAMTCGIGASGAAWCWGSNLNSQLGSTAAAGTCSFSNVPSYPCSGTPLPVDGGHSFESIAVGLNHVCALGVAGDVWCWGGNAFGQLGDGSVTERSSPVQVLGLKAAPVIGSIVVTPATAFLQLLGSTQQFAATALDEAGTPLASQPSFTFTSSNPAVASVTPGGLAMALATGSAVISATASTGQSGRAALAVNILDPVVAFSRGWGGSTTGGSDGVVVLGGLLSDEWTHSGTFPTRREVDRRNIANDNVTIASAFSALALARTALEFEIARLGSVSPSDARLGELRALAGYVYLGFAETYCSGVPLDDPNVGVPTPDLFARAIARFAEALGGPISAPHADLARIGTARAQLGLGNWPAAGAAAATVPDAFSFGTTHSAVAGAENFVFLMNTQQRRVSLADVEGATGLPYRSANDPRVPWDFVGLGFNAVSPQYNVLKFASAASPLPVASGTEARLIEAEAVLNTGDVTGFLARINALRAAAGLTMAGAPASPAAAVDLLFRERAFWLFATGQRLGDLRRLVAHYGRSAGSVFPVGAYPLGGDPYGTDANLPVPSSARGSTYAGCTDRTR